ncbi:MAG: universal stress protein [Bacteroidales bacterium]|nr:universal stress protein [Bacteroidales bacterium]
MKEILVAVDFSKCSINALEHAISIGQKGKADIMMVWVNNPSETRVILSNDMSEHLVQEVEQRFKNLIKKYRDELPDNNIDYTIREGKVYKEIVRQAQDNNNSLLVTGTHGTTGFEEFWIGSDAYKIVMAAPCPVLTIREGIDIHRDMKRVVLPIDSTRETRQKVSFAAKLASFFNAKIYVLGLLTTKEQKVKKRINTYIKQVSDYLEEKGIQHHQEITEADNITRSTLDYAKKVDANLIAIMTEQEKSASNIWLGPYAQQMVNHSPIPVLSIHPKDLMISLSR